MSVASAAATPLAPPLEQFMVHFSVLDSDAGCDPSDELDRRLIVEAATVICREQRRASFEAVDSFWCAGDSVRRLQRDTRHGDWRRVLRELAAAADVSQGRLDDAARASFAFPPAERTNLLHQFDLAKIELTISHVVELARARPPRRAAGIEFLLSVPRSTLALRSYLKRRE